MVRCLYAAMFFAVIVGPATAQTSSVQGGDKTGQQQETTAGQTTNATRQPAILDPGQTPDQQQAGRNSEAGRDRVGTGEAGHDVIESRIANFTVVLAVATILLMVATTALWWETRKLATFASKQAEDTKKALAIAARAADAATVSAGANRAWLTVSGPYVTAIMDPSQQIIGFRIGPILRNTGASPALNVSSALDFRDQDTTPDEQTPIFEVPAPDNVARWNSFGVIGPHSTGQIGGFDLPLSAIQLIETRAVSYYIASMLRYKDVYSDTVRITNLISRIMVQGTSRQPDGRILPAIAFMTVGEQNEAT